MAINIQTHSPVETEVENGDHQVNVGPTERLVSVVSGGLLALAGLSRRSWAGLGLAASGGYLVYRGLTGHCTAYESMGVNMAEREEGTGISLQKTVTVYRPLQEVYRFWHNFENLPRFMKHLTLVKNIGPGQTHWAIKVPGGFLLEWDAEVTDEKENEFISWQSLPNADVENRGTVSFKAAPGNRGTEVRVELEYYPPGGVPGVAFAKLFNRATAQQIKEDMRRFKHIMETGETPTIEGQPHGPRTG